MSHKTIVDCWLLTLKHRKCRHLLQFSIPISEHLLLTRKCVKEIPRKEGRRETGFSRRQASWGSWTSRDAITERQELRAGTLARQRLGWVLPRMAGKELHAEWDGQSMTRSEGPGQNQPMACRRVQERRRLPAQQRLSCLSPAEGDSGDWALKVWGRILKMTVKAWFSFYCSLKRSHSTPALMLKNVWTADLQWIREGPRKPEWVGSPRLWDGVLEGSEKERDCLRKPHVSQKQQFSQ